MIVAHWTPGQTGPTVEEQTARRSEAFARMAKAGHKYVSTYCVHDLHQDCRLSCKHCEAPCLCPCHKAGGMRPGCSLTVEPLADPVHLLSWPTRAAPMVAALRRLIDAHRAEFDEAYAEELTMWGLSR